MSVVLKDSKAWKRSIEAISSLISEGNFEFAEDGLRFSALDPSQVAFVDFFMPSSSFEEYKSQPRKVGLDLVEFSKVVLRALPQDRLSMDVEGSDLVLRLDGTLNRKFKLPLLNISDEETPKPKVQSTATVELPAHYLKEPFKDAALFASSVVLRVQDGKLVIEAQGTPGSFRAIIKPSDEVKIEASEEVVSKYNLNFLNNILKGADSGEKLKLELKTEAPMRISYDVGQGHISYFFANMML